MGEGATSTNGSLANTANVEPDNDPTPSFRSPEHDNAEIRFRVEDDDGDTINNARIFVGHFEARVSPIADTNPATTGLNLDDVAEFAPGTYELLAQAPGYGFLRGRADLPQGRGLHDRVRDAEEPRVHDAWRDGFRRRGRGVPGPAADRGPAHDHPGHPAAGPEHAHRRHGAHNWTAAGNITGGPPGDLSVDGKQATIDLAGTAPVRIRHIQVSSMLRSGVVATPGLANSSQNRFTALRQFEVWACRTNCSSDSGFSRVYTSRADAFPGDPPRPVSPHMILREFDIPNVTATHLRLVVKTSQCTGGPAFQGEQDADPTNTHGLRLERRRRCFPLVRPGGGVPGLQRGRQRPRRRWRWPRRRRQGRRRLGLDGLARKTGPAKPAPLISRP